MTPIQLIAQRLNLREKQVEQTIALLDEGATIPFISRYRKEATGGLDEVAVAAVAEQHRQLDELEHRKAFVLETIEAQGALTDELRARITACWDATEIEDICPSNPNAALVHRWHAKKDSNRSRNACCCARTAIRSRKPKVF